MRSSFAEKKTERIYIGIGSNLGDPVYNCLQAMELVAREEGVAMSRKSSLYKTEPIGYSEQPWFVNAVVEVETALDPGRLWERLQAIERSLGRERRLRWGPRPLDLDLLFWGDRMVVGPDLVIPHPRAPERRFVLAPMAEIAPDWRHPVLGKSVGELLEALGTGQEVVRIESEDHVTT